MKTKTIVTREIVIAGRAYAAGEELLSEHASKLANLQRLGHVAEQEVAEPKTETKAKHVSAKPTSSEK